jgi:hypothetical protein
MTRFITLTAIVATLAALWLATFAATAGPVRVLPARTARPEKVMSLVCELHRVTVLSAYEKLEPALKIARSAVDSKVAQTTSSSQQHDPSLPEEAR